MCLFCCHYPPPASFPAVFRQTWAMREKWINTRGEVDIKSGRGVGGQERSRIIGFFLALAGTNTI